MQGLCQPGLFNQINMLMYFRRVTSRQERPFGAAHPAKFSALAMFR
jgi:hypothetical protein